jgi:hypothetical protein
MGFISAFKGLRKIYVSFLSYPRCAENSLQVVQLATERNLFIDQRLDSVELQKRQTFGQGETAGLQKCFINGAELLQICRRTLSFWWTRMA